MTYNPEKISGVKEFISDHIHEMPDLYNTYNWDNDPPIISHQKLFNLEKEISSAAKTYSLNAHSSNKNC